jgi:hypothetical protein
LHVTQDASFAQQNNRICNICSINMLAATFREQFLGLKAGVFLSLHSMLVLIVVGRLQSHIICTRHATVSCSATCAAFKRIACMFVLLDLAGRVHLYWLRYQVQTIRTSKMLRINFESVLLSLI